MQGKRKRERSDSVLRHAKRFKNRFGKLDKRLETLEALVGMDDVKKQVMGQLKLLLCNDGKTDDHYLNCCITGEPGSGKTSLAKVLFKLWSSLSVFSEGAGFSVLTRSHFCAQYMGQTATKTRKALYKHKGGCLFIDEAYSLITGDNDSYGLEALTEINNFLSENPDTVVIFAGYKDEMEKLFLAQPGLRRRVAWDFHIGKYSAEQIFSIFKIQLKKFGWSVEESALALFKNKDFKYSGGDTENICLRSKISYAERNWMHGGDKLLLFSDVEKAIEQHFKDSKEDKISDMYL